MTTPVLDRARAVLLDFDGPVCSVFAGYPAPDVARLLRGLIARAPGPPLVPTARCADPTDPLGLLRAAAAHRPDLVPMIDDALTAAETLAVRSAQETPGVLDFLLDCRRAGRPVVVVSNNSAVAVAAYLADRQLLGLVQGIMGRPVHRPGLMKPHPMMVTAALAQLDLLPDEAVLIGDSVTDIEVARRCGVPAIGFATAPGADRVLAAAGADEVIDSISLLASDGPARSSWRSAAV